MSYKEGKTIPLARSAQSVEVYLIHYWQCDMNIPVMVLHKELENEATWISRWSPEARHSPMEAFSEGTGFPIS